MMNRIVITGGHKNFPLLICREIPREFLGVNVDADADEDEIVGVDVRDELYMWLRKVLVDGIMSNYKWKNSFLYFQPNDVKDWVWCDGGDGDDGDGCVGLIRIPLGLSPPPKFQTELFPGERGLPENVKAEIRKEKIRWWIEFATNALEDYGESICIRLYDDGDGD